MPLMPRTVDRSLARMIATKRLVTGSLALVAGVVLIGIAIAHGGAPPPQLYFALVVFFVGQALTRRVAWLERFSVPAPVVGGVLIAVVLAFADGVAGTRVSFDMALKDPLLLVFFTTVGLAADARMLVQGGPRLLLFLLVCTVYIVLQNAIDAQLGL